MDDVFDIVIDVQNDFMSPYGKLYVPNAKTLVEPIQQHIASLDSRGVLFTYDTHIEQVYANSEEAKQFPIHCIKASDGWQLAIDHSAVTIPKFRLEKGVFNMWQERVLFVHGDNSIIDRDLFFEELLDQGIKRLRFCGVAADYCVKWGIEGALARGFEVSVLADLTMGIERDMKQVVHDDFADRVSLN
jgi:nicotinamidase/pyrazinamidase